MLLSIDQSISCTGITIFSDGELIFFECIKTDKETGSNVFRINLIANRILELYEQYKCNSVVCEGLAYGSVGDATRNLAALLGVIEDRMFELGVDTIPKMTPTSVKKHAGGGKFSKKEMFNALPDDIQKLFLAKHARTSGSYDLADSYWIGQLFISQAS